MGGREVLIKSIAQAIPCYSMNCFRIPKKVIQILHQTIARFWWKGSYSDRSIHWLSWDSLCAPKCLGGMGFCDLISFNRALLAKQCWRLLQDPSSLLYAILKGKYFPNGSLLTAEIGA